ncbi:ribosomal protein S12 methylthiotransferase accessory factor [Terracoccus luteus]|uniref:Ribosomal protein S12 methylthiotransferase accessory factor n=1 Tax=Terracoccus luteus TaxID=53356 RepID=A0A495Y2C4_9MICO|nr:TOMM precursor leader peptide-binding protein [Terracoccus luteus]RKT79849.1 ribosomal protein S12 methylthiotransferase accessory factor [Terracoccus luteus]
MSQSTTTPATAVTPGATRVLRFKRSSTVTLLDGEGVYVSTERGARSRIHGRLVSDLYPLLDGTRDRGAVEDALLRAGHRDPAAAIDRLLRSGHVVEVDPDVDVRSAGYWEQCGLDGDASVEATASTIGVLVVGDDLPDRLAETAAEHGLRARVIDTVDDLPATEEAQLRLVVVLTDDYERPELAAVNAWSRRTGSSWLLAKPMGVRLWIGPTFTPGRTACYECLRVRLESKSLTESYLRQRGALSQTFVESVTGLPSTRRLGVDLALQSAATWLAGVVTVGPDGVDLARAGDVVTLDTVDLTSARHHLDARPQCSVCGDGGLQARLVEAPVQLVPRPKARTSDGGHRALTPDQFVQRYERFVSDITGPVSHLVALPLEVPGLHVYSAGQNFAMPMQSIADLKAGLRSASCGKGKSPEQAKASALGEAIERYSGVFHGDEPRVVASLDSFASDEVVHPNELHQYSDSQFAERAAWNARPSHFHWVGDAIDPAEPVEWTPLWSLSEQRRKWAPTSVLYYNYSTTRSRYNGGANSNGCAAGASLEDAVLQGFMELVERDATAVWWYNRSRRRAVDLASFEDPYFTHWQEQYDALDRRSWVLDITTDLGIPTFVAISHRTDKPAQDILLALGSHFDASVAIGRALSEMNQFLPAVIGMPSDGSGTYAFTDPTQVHWWSTATIESEPYLVPDPDVPAATPADFVDLSRDDLAEDVDVARGIVERAGMEMLVLDQTRPDIGLPVARVVVPGMRHFWPRYAAGRLYDVPVALGLQSAPTPEADLNPIAMFL